MHNGSLNGNAGGHDPSGQQQPSNYELSMSAMYGQSGLQAGNGQMPHHLLGSASNNNSSSSSTTNGPVSNDGLNNGLMDGHLLVEPKQEPEINSQFMQL